MENDGRKDGIYTIRFYSRLLVVFGGGLDAHLEDIHEIIRQVRFVLSTEKLIYDSK